MRVVSSSLWSLVLVAGAVFVVVGAFSACPSPPHGEGEGEGEGVAGEGEGHGGEGEGEGHAGEGEGEGSIDPGDNVVPGANLSLEDVTGDGSTIAFRDGQNALHEVPTAGGTPTNVQTSSVEVDKAEYHGPFLVAYAGVDAAGKIAATADVRDAGGAIGALGSNVRISTVKASPDGAHLYHEEAKGTVPNGNSTSGIEDLFLDGNDSAHRLLDDLLSSAATQGDHASKEKIHFSPTSNVIVVGAKIVDALGNTVRHVVRTYPLASFSNATFATIGDDASNDPTRSGPDVQNEITVDGNTVFFGAGKNSNIVTLSTSPTDGSGVATTVEANVDTGSFKLTPDGAKFLYMIDTTRSGAIHAVATSGGAPTTVKSAGAVDLGTVTATHVVYATSIDATTGNKVLAVIGLDGTGDTPLAQQGNDDGATSDGAFILFRDNVASGVGDLKVFDAATGAISSVASGVDKVQIANDNTVVFVDGLKSMSEATLGAQIVVKHIADNVDHFVVVKDAPGGPAHKVAYSRATDGIWVATLE